MDLVSLSFGLLLIIGAVMAVAGWRKKWPLTQFFGLAIFMAATLDLLDLRTVWPLVPPVAMVIVYISRNKTMR